MKSKRTNFQQLAYDKFSKLKVGALFMKMGSGKTRVAIDLVNYNSDACDLLLWVCPCSTKENCRSEIKKWGCKIPYKIIGYETLSQSDKIYLDLLKQVEGKRIFIVADESIFIKNPDSKRFRRCLNIRKLASYALILNGTPIVRDEMDLFWQMEFLSSKIFPWGYREFLTKFFDSETEWFGKKRAVKYKFSKQNAKVLYEYCKPYTFYCDLDFKLEETTKNYLVEPSMTAVEVYMQARANLLSGLKESDGFVLANLMALNQVISTDEARVLKTVEIAKNQKCIIYCQFVEEAKKIYRALPESYLMSSDKNERERVHIFTAAKNDNKPLIMTYGLGAYGLNLQEFDTIIFNSYGWDFGKLEQSKFRIKRLSQTNPIRYIFVRSNTKMQNLIDYNINRKDDILNSLREEIQRKGAVNVI